MHTDLFDFIFYSGYFSIKKCDIYSMQEQESPV